ncbi:hypothetical protein ACVWW5_006382 [Bradyrhizobium sp. LM3.4]
MSARSEPSARTPGSQLSAISTVWELMFCMVPIAVTPTPASERTRTDSTAKSLKTIDNFDITTNPDDT